MNWHSVLVYTDPGNMLEWMEKELSDLEAIGGSAIVMSHVPNLDECLRQYGRRFHAILDRFQTVIRAGIYSHTHSLSYQVVSDLATKKPIGMSYVIGSLTTYHFASTPEHIVDKDPNFCVMYLDPDTMIPIDYEVWRFDLKYANENNQPKWFKQYDYREYFGLPDLSPKSFMDFTADQILKNETAALLYRDHINMNHPDDECDIECRTKLFCEITTNDFDEQQSCLGKGLTNSKNLINVVFNMINHHWYQPIDKYEDL